VTPSRRSFLAGLTLATAGLATAPAFGQRQPIKILVGFPPGGLPDLVARALAEHYRVTLGTTAVVENRVGANGRLAAQAVKNAAPDGNTLLLAPGLQMIHLPHVYSDLGYDVFSDFAPIGNVVDADFGFAINPKIPATTLKEFVDWARKNPDTAAYGSAGQGSAPHLMGAMLAQELDVKLNHVPYKGANFALTDVMGGHMASLWATTPFLLPQHANGRVRILATTGTRRAAKLPQVPTFRELGHDVLTYTDGHWMLAPAKTPPDVVARLSAATLEAVKSKEVQSLVTGQEAIEAPLGHAALAKLMREEYDRRGALIRKLGFTATQ
jgi:tripartite-type tricarboxylate transporter receptor subunit TctC